MWDVDPDESCKKVGDQLEIEWTKRIKALDEQTLKRFQSKLEETSFDMEMVIFENKEIKT